jgi:spore coat polysaccharide biosynthesis predicted glycosyltransferase SpsG
MGHVYRSLAIAEAIAKLSRADVAFLMNADHPEGIATVSQAGHPVTIVRGDRVDAYLQRIGVLSPDILINDLREMSGDYLRELSHLTVTTVNLVDTPEDLDTAEHYEQVVISVMNQENVTVEGFLGGPTYAILREQFRDRTKQVRNEPGLVLLSFGGSDPQGLTLKTARALQGLDPNIQVIAVAGPAFSWRKELKELTRQLLRPVAVIDEASGGHISELMLQADIMVGSGGMSVYEIAALGTPGIVMAQNAREDRRMREFSLHETIEYLGLGPDVPEQQIASTVGALLADAGRRRTMSARGRKLVDGLGADRAAKAVLDRRATTSPTGERQR